MEKLKPFDHLEPKKFNNARLIDSVHTQERKSFFFQGNDLSVKFIVSLALLAVLIVVGLSWSEYQLSTQNNDSRIVNISGRQRMLSQKISKVVATLVAKPDTETSMKLVDELEEALIEWESSHNALRYGDESMGIVGDNSLAINIMYADLDLAYGRIRNSGNTIITLVRNGRIGSSDFLVAASGVLLNEDSFLTGMDEIVFTHDREAMGRNTKSRITVFLVNFSLLLFLIFCWFSLIRPALIKAEIIDKAKTEFVSLASHQLRTPISTIGWYLEMLLAENAGRLSVEQKKYLDEIYASNHRMIRLVDALENVFALEFGTFIIDKKLTNIVTLAESVIHEYKSQIDGKKIIITSLFGKDIPLIQVDPKLLRIVFQNLLSNAVKYTAEKGKINLSLTLDNAKRIILFSISDNGYGIPKKQQDAIFTSLFRADNVRRKDTDGTGLGLYIVKSILHRSGGSIRFVSTENKGSTFFVTLPLDGMKRREP